MSSENMPLASVLIIVLHCVSVVAVCSLDPSGCHILAMWFVLYFIGSFLIMYVHVQICCVPRLFLDIYVYSIYIYILLESPSQRVAANRSRSVRTPSCTFFAPKTATGCNRNGAAHPGLQPEAGQHSPQHGRRRWVTVK